MPNYGQRLYWNAGLALGTPILLVCSFVGGGMAHWRWTGSLEMDFLIHWRWADGDVMAYLRWDGSLEMG